MKKIFLSKVETCQYLVKYSFPFFKMKNALSFGMLAVVGARESPVLQLTRDKQIAGNFKLPVSAYMFIVRYLHSLAPEIGTDSG